MTAIDSGVRCDNHVGEVFPPRCVACQSLTAEYKWLGIEVCPVHPMSLMPCERCPEAA